MRKFSWVILLGGVWVAFAAADCAIETDHEIEIRVKTCRELDPKVSEELKNYRGEVFGNRDEFLEKYYKAALVTNDAGQLLVYPTKAPHPCKIFPAKSVVKKMVSAACCDTGKWGKCLYGGAFLYDLGTKAPNTFQ